MTTLPRINSYVQVAGIGQVGRANSLKATGALKNVTGRSGDDPVGKEPPGNDWSGHLGIQAICATGMPNLPAGTCLERK